MPAARRGPRSSALILMKFVLLSATAETSPAADAGSAGGCIRPAAMAATGVVVTSSAIASTFVVEKLLPVPSEPALTVVCPTPTSAVERYVSGSRSASSAAVAITATRHARNKNFQRHRARK